jgi:type VI secretion system protein ImpA
MVDLDSLLRPIRDDAPAGDNLRDDPSPDSPYYRIKDARNAARAAERAAQMADDPTAVPAADWSAVVELAPQILAQHSKDLEIAAWYIEGLVREQGFEGLQHGFRAVRALVENFWDHLHPRPDEEGLRTRVGAIGGLNGDESEGTLIVPIGMAPLVIDHAGALGAWHHRSAREIAAIADPEARARRIQAGAVPQERIDAAIQAAPAEELLERRAALQNCLTEFDAMSSAFDARCGADAPPASNIRAALREALESLEYLTRHLVADAPAEAPAPAAGTAPTGRTAGQATVAAPGVIASREDAVAALGKVRDWYRKSEPHSPVSYLIEQAARWSQLPLHQLIAELIPDETAREHFQMRTGIPRASTEET